MKQTTNNPQDELLLALNEPPPFEIFDFPRKGRDGKPIGQVRIEVLHQEHHTLAKIQAHAAIQKDAARREIEKLSRDDLESTGIQSALADQTAIELLAMALHSTKPMPGSETSENPRYPLLFHGADDIRKKLKAEEIAVLFNAYLLTQSKYGPFETELEKEDVDAWITRLELDASSLALSRMPWPQLVEFAFSLAERTCALSRLVESQRSSLPESLVLGMAPYVLDAAAIGREPLDKSAWASASEATEVASRVAEARRPLDADV